MRRHLALAFFLAAWPVPAMHLRHSVQLFAWSNDGTTALIEDQVSGPEGGGITAFTLFCGDDPVTAVLTSNLSTGGGRKVERVSRADCREHATALKTAADSAGFDTVAIDPAKCAAPDRVVSLVGKTVVTKALKEGWKTTKKGSALVVTGPAKARLEVEGGGVAIVSPTERAIVVLSAGEEPELVGAYRRNDSGAFVRCK